jgi:hypothetical protein
MSGRAKVLLAILGLAVAMPASAQAPAPTTAFDGKYVGVSRQSSKSGSNPGAKCTPNGVPAPLRIKNGVIAGAGSGGWEGSVSPQGRFMMRNARSARIDGQIDPQGNIKAQYSGPVCIVTYVWRKRSG